MRLESFGRIARRGECGLGCCSSDLVCQSCERERGKWSVQWLEDVRGGLDGIRVASAVVTVLTTTSDQFEKYEKRQESENDQVHGGSE
jgi:hypothetical protein